MKSLLLSLTIILVSGFSLPTTATGPPATKGKGALALTHNAGAGNECGYMTDNESLYWGPATILSTPSGKTNGQCVMYLVDGPGTDKMFKYDGAFEWPGMGEVEFDCVVTPNVAACRFHSPR